MQKLAKALIVFATSLVGSWIGAALDHNNWWGWTSTILGLLGLAAGYVLARAVDDYIGSA